MADGSGVELLYKNFGILADAGNNIGNHTEAYKGIINGAKGSAGDKKLAAGFISRFYRHFPDLADAAMDAMLDMIEDEDAQIRRNAIKCLPDICKGASDPTLVTRVADVLTQLLPTDDATDLAMVKTSMANVLQIDTKGALSGIFSQIAGEDETVREKGIEYVSTSLMSMRHKLFLTNPENEKFLIEQIKKVLSDVSGEEFEVFMDVLGKLNYSSTPEGAQDITALISEQAELSSNFQSDDTEAADRFSTCFKQALKFCKSGSSLSPFLEYLCVQILPHVPSMTEQLDILQLLADGCLYGVEIECATNCTEPVHTLLLEYMPPAPEEGAEDPKLQFSVVECLLFTFHHFLKKDPKFLTGEETTDRLKELRQRLQYFARRSQSYHAQLQAAVKTKEGIQANDEQAKMRSRGLKTTANINALVKDFFRNPPTLERRLCTTDDFFRNPPTFSTTVQLSWGPKVSSTRESRPSVTSDQGSGGAPTKRKHSPIRFDLADKDPSPLKSSKRDTLTLYQPPKDRFSKNFSNGEGFSSYGGGWRGRRGRGGGRGYRGQFGRGRRQGTWRSY